eukprot:CAMPEP_0172726794 /NCGR_PEP_ID=MMETSP1074-20121228/91318_1 /TAXON_ID=2916 /ORGANISM="Ceratium fusus, Strain PA161109" /LENGTH=67 /DNA_ID=CAMNT_0013553885 /DNA_START=1 /DNA_END=200 /DNA_ORIENTATION=+
MDIPSLMKLMKEQDFHDNRWRELQDKLKTNSVAKSAVVDRLVKDQNDELWREVKRVQELDQRRLECG